MSPVQKTPKILAQFWLQNNLLLSGGCSCWVVVVRNMKYMRAFVTVRQRSCGNVTFFRCLPFCSWGGGGGYIHSGQCHLSRGGWDLRGGYPPPNLGYNRIRSASTWYTSWNAFLFKEVITLWSKSDLQNVLPLGRMSNFQNLTTYLGLVIVVSNNYKITIATVVHLQRMKLKRTLEPFRCEFKE